VASTWRIPLNFTAEQQGITRQHMDEFSLESQQKAGAGAKACRLAEEIVPVALKNRKGEPTGEMLRKMTISARKPRWKVWQVEGCIWQERHSHGGQCQWNR